MKRNRYKLLRSQIKGPIQLFGQDLLLTILKAASPGDSLGGTVALDRDFAVLLPSSNIDRHCFKLNFFFQELVHLSLNGVILASSNKSGAKVDSRHGIKIFMGAREATHHTELGVEQVLTVTAVWHTIIDD